ncbi:MAG TPA: hypothetical protein VN784_02155 [Candidatus Limnocylindrales bacterium]|nr:hypothetical protein [Candidatus Limnocylindrales bacterium]
MKSLNRSFYVSALTGLCLAVVSPVMGQPNSGTGLFTDITITGLGPNSQAGTMNGATLLPHFFNDAPASVGTYNNSYPGSISLSEANVNNGTGNGLERDIWYFSNTGGASPYQFTAADYFTATMNVTVTGGVAGKDIEAGFIFSNPAGTHGGDSQEVAIGSDGEIVQFGGVSFNGFSANDGGLLANYTKGQTVSFTFTYGIDPITTMNAFQYSATYQAQTVTSPWEDFGVGQFVGSPGDYLGGYFQIAPVVVPEPSMLALLGLSVLPLARLLRRRA